MKRIVSFSLKKVAILRLESETLLVHILSVSLIVLTL